MAKRKKLKNVKISEQELTPTILGYLDEKKASPLFLVIVFGILLAFLYYLPDINKYVEEKRGNYYNTMPSVPGENEEKFEQNDAGKEYDFSENTSIVMNEITFSDFKFENDSLSFVAQNNSNKMIDVGKYGYYIYLKDSDGNINDAIKLDDIVVLEKSEKDLVFNIESISISKVFIDVFKEEYINEVTLIDNTLTCTLNEDTYVYGFDNNNLINETYIYQTYSASDNLVYHYQKRKEKYEVYDGVEIDIDDTDGLYYKVYVDVNIADTTKLNDDNIFDKTFKPKVIKFKLEENGYSCN